MNKIVNGKIGSDHWNDLSKRYKIDTDNIFISAYGERLNHGHDSQNCNVTYYGYIPRKLFEYIYIYGYNFDNVYNDESPDFVGVLDCNEHSCNYNYTASFTLEQINPDNYEKYDLKLLLSVIRSCYSLREDDECKPNLSFLSELPKEDNYIKRYVTIKLCKKYKDLIKSYKKSNEENNLSKESLLNKVMNEIRISQIISKYMISTVYMEKIIEEMYENINTDSKKLISTIVSKYIPL